MFISFCFFFRSNDDQEVISYNNSTLPMYYGLLRVACNHSKQFCKSLSMHPNMTWAFEHLMPRANHYPQVRRVCFQLKFSYVSCWVEGYFLEILNVN